MVALSSAAVPSGVISVMPQAWMVRTPWRSKPRIIASLAADPPTAVRNRGSNDQRSASASSACKIPFQIVGTPAANVTRSLSQRSSRLTGSRWGPGMTMRAPAATAPKGSPQALAWNIGTTGMTVSC